MHGAYAFEGMTIVSPGQCAKKPSTDCEWYLQMRSSRMWKRDGATRARESETASVGTLSPISVKEMISVRAGLRCRSSDYNEVLRLLIVGSTRESDTVRVVEML